jgi:hypothetical protein
VRGVLTAKRIRCRSWFHFTYFDCVGLTLVKSIVNRTKVRFTGGCFQQVIDPFETPYSRRERYLRAAMQARGIAERASEEAIRERYIKLENVWMTLADEVELSRFRRID